MLTRDAAPRKQLRRWAFWSTWIAHQSWRARAGALRALVKSPAAAARDARAAVAVHGTAVRARHGTSLARQLADLWWLRVVHGIHVETYYKFQLYRPDRRPLAHEYVQVHEAERLLRLLMRRLPREHRRIFNDKPYFDRWCATHGLPSVSTLAEFVDGRLVADAQLPRSDLFSKPTNWQSGRGVHRWLVKGDDRWTSEDGTLLAGDDLIARLAAMSAELGRPILLQRFLRNHPELMPLTPGGLCTARVVTVRAPDGAVTPLLAVYRMPVGDTPADNFDLGGIAAPIALSTGRLGEAVRKRDDGAADAITRHPDTGAVIPGHQLPRWPEALRLATAAHAAVDGAIPFIGWDIAILETGPVLLEANNVPCSVLSQLPSGVPLGVTEYPARLAGALRDAFAGADR